VIHSQCVPSYTVHGVGPYQYVDAVVLNGPMPGGGAAPVAVPERVPVPGMPRERVDYSSSSAESLVDRGDALFAGGRYAEAVGAYEAAAKKAPEDAMAAFALGHGLFAVGRFAEAAAALRKGVRIFPDVVSVRMDRRAFYGNPADFDAQLRRLSREIELSPDDAEARFLLAYNYFFTQRFDLARREFESLGPADAEAKLFLEEMAEGR
jgi:tetratricopeptide (TPR) repeat protein